MTTTINAKPQVVTVENFVRAESDSYFARIAERGAFGKFVHRPEPLRVDQQLVIRGNPDVLTSQAIFDLDAGPVTIQLPDAGTRLMSLQVLNQDHFTESQVYGPVRVTLTRSTSETRYVLAFVRTLVDPWNPDDVAQAQALQQAIAYEQASTGTLELAQWDAASLAAVREPLVRLSAGMLETHRMFGRRGEVDPVRHLIGTAFGWGGQPEQHAYYLNVTPKKNDGQTVHRLVVTDVPVDGYWSITVYNEMGFMERNARESYAINNLTAQRSPDGSVEIQFGGCKDGVPNCIPIMKGWNYLVRLYRARPEVLQGTWHFPEAEPLE